MGKPACTVQLLGAERALSSVPVTAMDLVVQPGNNQTHQTATVPLERPVFRWTAALRLFQRGLRNVLPL